MGLIEDSRDGLVVTAGIVFALVVSATDVNAKGNAGVAIDYSVVQLDTLIEEFVWITASLAIAVSDLCIQKSGILRSVDLDIGAAKTHQFLYLAPRHRYDVSQIGIARWIRRF